jgi:hypothetical protein
LELLPDIFRKWAEFLSDQMQKELSHPLHFVPLRPSHPHVFPLSSAPFPGDEFFIPLGLLRSQVEICFHEILQQDALVVLQPGCGDAAQAGELVLGAG